MDEAWIGVKGNKEYNRPSRRMARMEANEEYPETTIVIVSKDFPSRRTIPLPAGFVFTFISNEFACFFIYKIQSIFGQHPA